MNHVGARIKNTVSRPSRLNYIHGVVSGRFALFIILLFFGCGAVLSLMNHVPVYKASVVIEIINARSNLELGKEINHNEKPLITAYSESISQDVAILEMVLRSDGFLEYFKEQIINEKYEPGLDNRLNSSPKCISENEKEVSDVSVLKTERSLGKLKQSVDLWKRQGSPTAVLSFKNQSPAEAMKLANLLASELDNYLRELDLGFRKGRLSNLLKHSTSRITSATSSLVHDKIEEDVNKILIIEAREQYVLRILDPATLPKTPLFPRKSDVFLFILGCAAVFLSLYLAFIGELRR
ncbi:hypothetical protein [Marinobacter adhaerens]|uniref:hypothetical protein n=1 Tax=Marinobacter adhaerens TaxID=1033846 RepID=UPI003F6FFE15